MDFTHLYTIYLTFNIKYCTLTGLVISDNTFVFFMIASSFDIGNKMKYGYSIKEIVKITLPLILNAIIMNLMFVVDRIILTSYSLDSMNAAALGGSFGVIALFCGIGVTQTASVFVGQYNGMKEYRKIGQPIWQMIYFSLILMFVFIPAGMFCDNFGLFPEVYQNEGVAYLRPLLSFGWLPALSSSFVSFFVGRGKILPVVLVFLGGNVLNAILDYAFVFGVNGILPAMGAAGAAYSTLIGEIFFILCFSIIFFKREYRKKFGTMEYKFVPKLMLDCIKVGLPVSMGKVASQVGWLAMMYCFARASQDLATCESFAVLIWMLFIVFADGCGRALTVLGANLIGKNQKKPIENLLKLFLKFNCVLSAIFAIPLVMYQSPILHLTVNVNGELAHLNNELSFLMISMWVILFLDGVYYFVCGVLNAGGDTKFPMILETASLWIGAVLPTFILYCTGCLTSIRPTYVLIPITQLFNVIVIYFRYRKKHWFQKIV